jgi:copper(I)-binding protein
LVCPLKRSNIRSGVKSVRKNFCGAICHAAIAGFWLWSTVLAAGEAGLEFDGAWIRDMPPGMKMTAGFGQLRNSGTETIELVTFSSPEFGSVSLHRTVMVDGMSRMREVPSLSIAAGETIELAPGGFHLMLMTPAGPASPDQTISVDMTASDGHVFHFQVPVERR